MMFPVRFYIKEYAPVFHRGEEFFWRSLCIVYDNESLGLMERLLQRSDLEYKWQSVESRDAKE